MNLKKWAALFGTTLLVGGIASLITGFYMQGVDPNLNVIDLPLIIFNFGIGLMYSVFSQMGFFAYLMVNYIAQGIIKRRVYWVTLQWVLILIVFFDLIYLRVTNFVENNAGVTGYSILPIVLLTLSVILAIWKSKLTNWSALTPTIFFLFVVTTIEIIPALRENSVNSTLLMLVPIFCCNAWQILRLHRILQTKES